MMANGRTGLEIKENLFTRN
jgi:hypothetical protein